MNYSQALEYLHSSIRMRYDLGLSRMEKMLAMLGSPEQSIKAVHVTGTKGKGSTCAFIVQALQDAGYKTGFYSSPELTDIRDRIQINRKNIPRERFSGLVGKLKKVTDQMPENEQPTFFELMTALAFLYFFEEKVDYAVVEVGMGGRLDATNVCVPVVTAITNIDLDHVQYLGDTREKIAVEKAGIIKQGIPVVTGITDHIFEIIKRVADSKGAPITKIEEEYVGKLSLKGDFQKKNAAVALETIKQLREKLPEGEKLKISDENIAQSFRKTKWRGRMQKKGNILLDCAHNVASFKALAHELKKMKYSMLIPVFAISIEKDLKGIFEVLNPLVDFVIVTKTENYRAESTENISKFAKNPVVKEKFREALEYAREIAKEGDLILVTSCYGVGEALKILKR